MARVVAIASRTSGMRAVSAAASMPANVAGPSQEAEGGEPRAQAHLGVDAEHALQHGRVHRTEVGREPDVSLIEIGQVRLGAVEAAPYAGAGHPDRRGGGGDGAPP